MKRYEIINSLILKNNYKKYLEIGVQQGNCFTQIKCEYKVGVDPAPESLATINLTSDDFFKNLHKDEKFDLIFIDGLHINDQVDRDIENSLSVLNNNGCIILHDCNPTTESQAKEFAIEEVWMGTVYLSLTKLRLTRDDLSLITIDCDSGVGILIKNKSEKLNYKYQDAMNWNFFNKNRHEILNLISPEEFKNRFLNTQKSNIRLPYT